MGGAIALAVLGGGAYLVSGGDVPLVTDVFNNTPTPAFAFDSVKFTVEGTTETSEEDLHDAAQPAADEIEATLTALIQGTFVDDDTWGDYQGVFADAMTEQAAAGAAEEVDTLTLGAAANDDYEFVEPDRGVLRLTILTDLEDRPVEASATLTFTATAEATDGSFTKVKSIGTYLLRVEDGAWKIFSFDVTRSEKATKAPTSASPSAEASS